MDTTKNQSESTTAQNSEQNTVEERKETMKLEERDNVSRKRQRNESNTDSERNVEEDSDAALETMSHVVNIATQAPGSLHLAISRSLQTQATAYIDVDLGLDKNEDVEALSQPNPVAAPWRIDTSGYEGFDDGEGIDENPVQLETFNLALQTEIAMRDHDDEEMEMEEIQESGFLSTEAGTLLAVV